jgi:hypothetical protein
VKNKPAEQDKYDNASPENPYILFRPALDHSDRITANAQRVANAVQSSLRVLEDIALLTQVGEDSPAPVQELVQLRVGL